MIFAYRGFDTGGNRVKSRIEAASVDEARKKLKNSGILYEQLSPETGLWRFFTTLQRRTAIAPRELARLSHELATYMRSGMTIVDALRVVQTRCKDEKKLALFLHTLTTYLEEGKGFYAALQLQQVIVLPEYYKQSIRVSESTGILDEVLFELSRFLGEQASIAKEVRSAFVYPLFMLAVSLFMVAFMLTFVVPRVTAIFEGMNQELPAVTQFVIATSHYLQTYYAVIFAGFIAAAVLYALLRRFSRAAARFHDRMLLALPLFGPIILKNELGRFAYVGSLLVRSGVTFVQTIDLAAKVLENRVIATVFARAAGDVVEGKRLSQALETRKRLVDSAFIQAVALGEESSQVERVLANLSQLCFDENRDRITLMLTLLEPLLMLLVGGLIGFIVAAMLLPIFSMSIA